MSKLKIFLDYWNFLNEWDKRARKRLPKIIADEISSNSEFVNCEWNQLPLVITEEVISLFRKLGHNPTLQFDGIRVYTATKPDNKAMKQFFLNLDCNPGYTVDVKDQKQVQCEAFCQKCETKVTHCPTCKSRYMRYTEKGVDTALITDMFGLYLENSYDLAVLVSADSDMIPMVQYLQNKGMKIINATWRGKNQDLQAVCWASILLDDLVTRLLEEPMRLRVAVANSQRTGNFSQFQEKRN